MRPVLRLSVALALAAGMPACSREARPFDRGADTIRFDASQPRPGGPAVTIPNVACADSVVAGATIRETAAIVPEERRRARPQDAGWIPARLTDLAASERHTAVVDPGLKALTVFAPDFTSRMQRERPGGGPGEMQLPIAVAMGPEAEPVWVLDERRAVAMAFSHVTEFIREIRTGPSAVDLAVGEDGVIFIAHRVLTGPARIGNTDSAVVVSRYASDGTPLSPLVSLGREALVPPRFVLPAVTEAGVVLKGDRVAVYYPAGGVVDIYRDGRHQGTARVCMPPGLSEAYARQRESPQGGQSWIALITDVRFEPDGGFSTVASRPDNRGRFLIHRFRADGTSAGSVAIDNPGIAMPSEVRFGATADQLIAFAPESGIIASFSVRPR